MFDHYTRPVAVRAVAVLALVAEIAIHAVLAPDHLEEMPYIGALFVAASVLLTVVLVGVLVVPQNELGWLAGAAICGGMVVAFVVSRTLGLPGYHEGWTSDAGLGLVSLPPDIVFVLCWLAGASALRSDHAIDDRVFVNNF